MFNISPSVALGIGNHYGKRIRIQKSISRQAGKRVRRHSHALTYANMRINNEISKDEFTKNKKRLKDRQYEITELIHAYDVTEDEFNNRLICLLNIATGASRAFRGSDTHEKREMLSFIFQNLELRDKKLEYTMRYPFNLFADANKTGEWCGREDSNFHGQNRPQRPQRCASTSSATTAQRALLSQSR